MEIKANFEGKRTWIGFSGLRIGFTEGPREQGSEYSGETVGEETWWPVISIILPAKSYHRAVVLCSCNNRILETWRLRHLLRWDLCQILCLSTENYFKNHQLIYTNSMKQIPSNTDSRWSSQEIPPEISTNVANSIYLLSLPAIHSLADGLLNFAAFPVKILYAFSVFRVLPIPYSLIWSS